MNTFSYVFLAVLFASTLIQLWLDQRHLAHIKRHRDAVPPVFADRVTLASHQLAADYSSAKTRFDIATILFECAFALALTFGGGLQWLNDLTSTWFNAGILRGIALIALVALLSTLVDLPFSYFRTFIIEQRFGFNRMTKRMFIADTFKHLLLAAAFGLPLIAAVLWLMAKAGIAWWLYAWILWVAFNLFLLVAYPLWIAPLFNKFSPLDNAGLRERIEQLLARCGFQAQGLFVMDGSTRSSHGNAYFTGFGKARRIVFFDTLLTRLDGDEIEAVLAHELGHFKLHHVVKRMVWIFAGSLVMLWLLSFLMNQTWFYAGLHVNTVSTAMALVLFFIALPPFTFLLHPLFAAYSRKHEFEADAYAVKQASASALISALVKLYQDNAATLTPDPLHSSFHDSHPPAPLRIARLQSIV